MEKKANTSPSPGENGLLQTNELYEYILKTNVYPRESGLLKELRAISSNHPWAAMGTTPDVGQFMELLLKLANAKKTIEIGVFTGYSLLLTALTIPEDGKITAIDPDRDTFEIGLPIIKKANVDHKINFIESKALPVLDQLLKDPKNQETFDFAFVDADKENYADYHEKLLELVKLGGIIMYDNTLWAGSVAMPDEAVVEFLKARRYAKIEFKEFQERLKVGRHAMIEFNKFLAADTRVQISQVPVGDGVTICYRL